MDREMQVPRPLNMGELFKGIAEKSDERLLQEDWMHFDFDRFNLLAEMHIDFPKFGLDLVSNKDFEPWLQQKGFPRINVIKNGVPAFILGGNFLKAF